LDESINTSVDLTGYNWDIWMRALTPVSI